MISVYSTSKCYSRKYSNYFDNKTPFSWSIYTLWAVCVWSVQIRSWRWKTFLMQGATATPAQLRDSVRLQDLELLLMVLGCPLLPPCESCTGAQLLPCLLQGHSSAHPAVWDKPEPAAASSLPLMGFLGQPTAVPMSRKFTSSAISR